MCVSQEVNRSRTTPPEELPEEPLEELPEKPPEQLPDELPEEPPEELLKWFRDLR